MLLDECIQSPEQIMKGGERVNEKSTDTDKVFRLLWFTHTQTHHVTNILPVATVSITHTHTYAHSEYPQAAP